jgi:serine/threonine protein kinase
MTPEELGRIRSIYEQAVPMSAPARAAFLDRECQENEGMREHVLSLLRGHDNAPDWLERPVLGVSKEFVSPESPRMEGRRFGGYTLIREIGRGGAGVVYLAERSDETFQRQVAIKLLMPPANSGAVLAQFHQEREILASLDHPNIAKLFDAGVTEEGWPFFVMELVDGQPINRWCDERKLTISQRLELFRGVIEAVRFAHQRLVIHRDLKPSNIFVTNDGVVKLLDFGIAKVMEAKQPGEAPETLTLAGMMTPEYASPEQVNGAVITTLSDVYSLGVVLYELLTGHRPYRLSSAALHQMVRVISEVEPARPSEVVTTSESSFSRDRTQITPETVSAVREGDPHRLRKRLAGDLDSILLMALRKEPERRYGSVESLAEDLRRHLEQRPVNAREATPWERFQRSVRRNPGGFLAGGLVATLLLAGLAAVAIQARHDIQTAQLNRGFIPFIMPLWLFSSGIAIGILIAAFYFARPNRSQRMGVAIGGVVWGLCLAGVMKAERALSWWRSGVQGNEDPLLLLSGWTWLIFPVAGTALLLILLMIGRRFGWQGQIVLLALLGLYQAVRERIWFGEFIPALHYQPGILPVLGSAAMIMGCGLLGLIVMRLTGGPGTTTARDRK